MSKVRATPCVNGQAHRWLLEPQKPQALGVCRLCGAERLHAPDLRAQAWWTSEGMTIKERLRRKRDKTRLAEEE